jgi:histidinol-phosphate aminotransferase
MTLPIREDLRGLTPYGAPQRQDHAHVRAHLNVNENPHPPSPALTEALAKACGAAAATMNRYPDREATELRAALATYLGHGLTAEQVWAANGSNEIIAQVLQAFGGPGRTALGFDPSYSMHPELARTTGTTWIGVPRRADFTLDMDLVARAVSEHHPDVLFITSPNNPTGGASPLQLVEVALSFGRGIVVVDEAYAEFGDAPTALSLLPGNERLVVIRTMSKAFAFAGARVGYLAADPSVIDALRLVRLPYHLSALTQAAALTALAHRDELLASVDAVVAERRRLVAGVEALGLRTVPTDANFFLFGPFDDPPLAFGQLLERGVLVRDVSSGPGLAGWLRVCAGTPDEGEHFLLALKEIL